MQSKVAVAIAPQGRFAAGIVRAAKICALGFVEQIDKHEPVRCLRENASARSASAESIALRSRWFRHSATGCVGTVQPLTQTLKDHQRPAQMASRRRSVSLRSSVTSCSVGPDLSRSTRQSSCNEVRTCSRPIVRASITCVSCERLRLMCPVSR